MSSSRFTADHLRVTLDHDGMPQRPPLHFPEADVPKEAPARQPLKRSRKQLLLLLGGAFALSVGIVRGVRAWQFGATHVATDDAYLMTDTVPITPQVAGNVAQVLVRDNQRVRAGQPLVILDDATFRADVDQAQANLAVAQATAEGSATHVGLTTETGEAQIEQASGGVTQAESAVAVAQADVERARAGVANAQAASAGAQANIRSTEAAVEASQAARRRAEKGIHAAQAQLATAQAAVQAAQANVVAAQANAERASNDEARLQSLFREDAISAQSVDAAIAAAKAARAQVESMQEQVRQAQATVEQRRAEVEAAQEAVHAADAATAQSRAQVIAAQETVRASQATVRQMRAQQLAAQKNVLQAQARRTQAIGQFNQARTAPRQVAVSRAVYKTDRAKILQAKAAFETAQINLRRTRLDAPCDGVISRKSVQLGQQVAIGQPLMAILPSQDVWVVANFKETQMRNVHPGQKVEIEVDTLPGHPFTGHVESLAAGTGATFALLPPDNATGNFTKIVQRVPVKILFDPGQKDLDRLRAGLSVVATVETR
jgi:membrane fusion protein (multidrug efflux system)